MVEWRMRWTWIEWGEDQCISGILWRSGLVKMEFGLDGIIATIQMNDFLMHDLPTFSEYIFLFDWGSFHPTRRRKC